MNDQQGYGWPNGSTQAHGAAPMPEPPRWRSGHGWIVGIVLVLIAVTSFALVSLLMKGKSSKNGATGASTVATAPGVAPSGAGSASPSVSTSATFPPEAVDTCMEGSDPVPHPNPDAEQVRMKVDTGTSCEFLRNTRAAVVEHRATHPDEDTFSVSPLSPSQGVVPLSCSPKDGFTYCVSAKYARIWVRNP